METEPLERMGERTRAKRAVENALLDLKKLTRSKFSFASPNDKSRYIETLTDHLVKWNVPERLAPNIAERVFKLHRRIVSKVDGFLRENYGHDIFTYDHDLELLNNALLRIHMDAEIPPEKDGGGGISILQDISHDPGKRRAYLRALDSAVQAVQSNFAITDHIIREAYTVAPYYAYLLDCPHISQLLDRALRRRYPRVLTDLRHMLDIFFSSRNAHHYLDAADSSIENFLKRRGLSRIPRQHIHPYAAQIVPFALHASFIDAPLSRKDGNHALWEVSRYIFGPNGKYYFPRLRLLAQDRELYPFLIGIAKQWDRNLNPRAWDLFVHILKHGKHAAQDLVDVEGKVAWGDLWPHLSRSVAHVVKKPERSGDDRSLVIALSKTDVLGQIGALSDQPTCLTPQNDLGQIYGLDYVLNPRKGDVMPLIAVARSVPVRGGRGRVVGRIVMFADPIHGNIHIVSAPVGNVNLHHYIDAAKKYGQDVNSSAGKQIFKRILVGGMGKYRFKIPVDDAYGDMIVKKDGQHYLRDAEVIPLD